jgi:DNA-binding transcriptional LysR family regulator
LFIHGFYQLQHFVAVAETGSFTRGAARVAVSQPALSAAVAKLEAEMGVKLFDRRRDRVVPTPAGSRLLEVARGVLLACNSIKADLRAIAAPRLLRVGVLRTLSTAHVADLVAAFRYARPDVAVALFDEARDALRVRLDEKKLDLALTSLDPRQRYEGEVELLVEPYVLAVNQDHRFAKLGSVKLEDLNNEPFIVRTSCETFQDTRKFFLARDIRTRLVYQTDQDDRALALVGAGLGMALIPALHDAPGVVKVPVSDFDQKRRIGLIWRPDAADERVDSFTTFARNHRWAGE